MDPYLHLGNNPTAGRKTGTLTTALLINLRQMLKQHFDDATHASFQILPQFTLH